MSNKVIEPSEILTQQDYGRMPPARVNPWVRFLARFCDYALFFLALLGIQTYFNIQALSTPFVSFIPFEFFAWIPLEALFLWTFGKTPGKWFLKTNLRFANQPRPDFILALRRSFSVWLRGLGLGIPILNILCLLTAYQKLKLTQTTSWDKQDHIHVTHHHVPEWRLYSSALFAAIGFLIYFSMKNAAA